MKNTIFYVADALGYTVKGGVRHSDSETPFTVSTIFSCGIIACSHSEGETPFTRLHIYNKI